jgi:hypothetical protein
MKSVWSVLILMIIVHAQCGVQCSAADLGVSDKFAPPARNSQPAVSIILHDTVRSELSYLHRYGKGSGLSCELIGRRPQRMACVHIANPGGFLYLLC